jgi:signal transduction histidine kinase
VSTRDSSVLERQNTHLINYSVLQKISSSIPFTDNINVITNQMLALATEYTRAEKGSVMILNERGELNISASRHLDEKLIKRHTVRIGEGIAGKVAEQRRAVLVKDIDNETSFVGNRNPVYKSKSFISCPITMNNSLLGVINLNDKINAAPFKEDELILLKIIADKSAAALERAFLINKLRTKTMELEEADSKLIDCEILKTEFIAQISQELRSPLNSIRGAIYYLQKNIGLLPEEQKEFFHIISKETENLISVTEELLDSMRLKDTISTSQKTLINIPELLKEIAESKLLRETFLKKNIQLNIHAPDNDLCIVGDKTKSRQVFINLMKIFSFYLENRDTIDISIAKKDGIEIMINLSRRMPDNVLSHFLDERRLFDFEKPYSMARLYLAKQVAHLHDWDLKMINNNGSCSISIKMPGNNLQKREVLINTTMQMFVEFISELLDIEICSVMLRDDFTGDLAIRSSRGLSDDIVKFTRVKIGERIVGKVAQKGEGLLIKDIERDLSPGKRNVPQYNTNSFISLPLKAQDKIVGAINISNKKNSEPFNLTDFRIASLMSNRISHFIEKFSLNGYDELYFRQFKGAFESLLNFQKKYYKKHSIVPEIIIKILDVFNASEEDKRTALYLSLVYDLGLMVIHEDISLKKDLSPLEAISLKYHPYNTISLLDILELSDAMKNIILHHHERYDGMGYPDGLKSEEIPFISRVLSIVDSFCAMISDRPYREKLTIDKALKEIEKGSGTRYDPNITNVLREIVKRV